MADQEVVELRVHGVSGTPPQELLDRGAVYRLAGNATAGFYRPSLAAESTDGTWAPLLPRSTDGPKLEGYAWGGLTSGAPSRAFWLLLLPFTLVNVAPRLRPPIPAQRDRLSRALVWLTWYLTRLLGLALTVLFVLAAAGIGDDLIGWQCGQGSRCAQANPQWFARLVFGVSRTGPNRHGLSVEHRLAVGTVIPLLIVALLWFISRTTVNRYETVAVAGQGFEEDLDAGQGVAGEVTLDSRWMWQNTSLVRRLSGVHVQAGLAAALWAVAGPLERSWRIDGVSRLGSELSRHPFGLLAALVISRGVVAMAVPSFSRHDASPTWHSISRGVWVVLVLGWVAMAARLLLAHRAVDAHYLTPSAAARTPAGGLPGYSASVLGLFLFEVCTLLALTVVLTISHWRVRHRPDSMTKGNAHNGFLGFGSLVIATTGMFLASVFSAGEYLFTAGWLHTGSLKPSFHELSMVPTAFHLPEVIKLASLAYVVSVAGLVVALLAGVGFYLVAPRFRWYGLIDVKGFELDYRNRSQHDLTEPDRRKDILQAYFVGRLVDFAGNSLLALVAFGAAVSGALSLILFGEHVWPMGWARRSAHWLSDSRTATHASIRSSIPGLEVVGAYLTVLTIVLMVALGALAFRVPATRRSVGILWDIASFWPRTAHPLAAPCYAERTVPDLITRIRWYRCGAPGPTGPGGSTESTAPVGVVLAAHSQGTVISSAALIQLAAHTPERPPAGTDHAPGDVLPGLSLLTFGCVLRRLYGRYFPVYFGAPVIDRLARQLGGTNLRPGRWLNLWRYTDYLGGAVTVGPPPQTGEPDAETTPSTAPILEKHLRDPAFFAVQPGDTVAGPPLRHSDFWKSPDGSFQAAVAELAEQV